MIQLIDDTKPTNRKKRGVQGKCKTCGSPIPAAKRLCPECRQQEQEAKENIHVWKSPSGEVIKRKVRGAHVLASVVFHIWGQACPSDCPSGDFLETLIGVCYERPPYIHPSDVARYASLLDSLLHYHTRPRPWERDSPTMAAQDIPLNRLDVAVREWVNSLIGDLHHPLMATYALDTAAFIAAHGEGKYFSSDRADGSLPAEIPAMVDDDFSIGCLQHPTFKAEFTQRSVGQQLIVGLVPDGGAVASRDETLLRPGEKFLFRIGRCHLSETWYGQYDGLKATQENEPDYDIGAVLLPGVLLRDAQDVIGSLRYPYVGRSLCVPLRWVTHAVRESQDKCDLLPVPQWE